MEYRKSRDDHWRKLNINRGLGAWGKEMRFRLLGIAKSFSYKPSYLAIGCGKAILERSLANLFKMTITDISEPLLAKLKKEKIDAIVERADVFNLHYEDQKFDVVVSEGMIEHFKGEDIELSIAEMCRVARHIVLIVAPHSGSEIYTKVKAHLIRIRRWKWGYEGDFYTLEPLIEKHGFTTLIETDIGGEQLNKTYSGWAPQVITGKENKRPYPYLMNISQRGTSNENICDWNDL